MSAGQETRISWKDCGQTISANWKSRGRQLGDSAAVQRRGAKGRAAVLEGDRACRGTIWLGG